MSYFDLFRGYGIHELWINYNSIVLLYIVAKASFFSYSCNILPLEYNLFVLSMFIDLIYLMNFIIIP